MRTTRGYAALGDEVRLEPWTFERRELRPDDVAVRVTYCGVCHSDLHALEAHTRADGPLVPGHEFVGVVEEVGPAVTRFAVGDAVAVGNIVDACGTCAMCRAGQENYCEQFPTLTYGGADRQDGSRTQGAYAAEYVVREDFVYALPEGLDPAATAPLLCAGITVWEPLVRWQAGPGRQVAVVGLGGLGHLAVKLAAALGAHVTAVTTSPGKGEDARRLGAHDVLVSSDGAAMAAARDRFDLVVDTVAAPHDLTPYLRTVALDGTLCTLAIVEQLAFDPMALLVGRKSVASAGSGGRPGTQALLDFCAVHGIGAEVEVLPSAQVGEALARLARGDVRYRFVLDLADLAA
jgi:uncharacterized zinc-type alcohol dehydrogenase-like protein